VDVGDVSYRADRVVMATGGMSVPKTGSDGWGLSVLERLGHDIVEPYPALTPLTADPPVHADLAGVSLEVALSAPPPGGPFEVEGGFLFTHRGWSGPATLNISHLAVGAASAEAQPIHVRWGAIAAKEWTAEFAAGGSRRVAAVLRQRLPGRLADRLIAESGVDGDRPLAQLRREERDRLLAFLAHYELPWTGDEGYRKAEVTGGGVRLADVRPDTLESRVAPGLFLCGELLDAFGPIGGYNFAWAWATGRAAGRGAATIR
jgi:predicted Rossmann fold flavoprotein